MITQLPAQTNVNMPLNTAGGTFTIAPPGTCSFNFYDNNGPSANYSTNSNQALSTITFAPSNAATHQINVAFSSFSTESSWDALYVFNGSSNAAPLISSGNGPTTGGDPAGGWWGSTAPTNTGMPGIVRGTGATGALTFAFASDASVTFPGWAAVVNQLPLTPCAITAPADLVASTGMADCTADVVTPAPSFNPGGCQAANQVQYTVDAGTPVVVPQPIGANVTLVGITAGDHTVLWEVVDPCGGAVVSSDVQMTRLHLS